LEELEEDPLYLKKFVKDHPENKMGWYLLGKQYEKLGKEGKAKYCFAQAGDVFRAFEMTQPPDHLSPEEQEWNVEGGAKIEPIISVRFKRRLITVYRSIMITLIILFLLTYLPTDAIEKAKEDDIAVSTSIIDSGLNVLYIQDGNTSNEMKEALQTILTPQIGQEKKLSILVKGRRSKDGQWVMWQYEPIPLISAQREANTGTLKVEYHDNKLCDCTAVDGSLALKTVEVWKQQQEQLIVLRSTMAAYKEMYGTLPEKADSLTSNFPKNVLPGLSEVMRKAYAAYTNTSESNVKNGNSPNASNSTEKPPTKETASSTPKSTIPLKSQSIKENYTVVPPLTDVLEIIVDPETHQLALVSGRVIVRKYPIGLGGGKTPKGSFTITEKVRNPNGHDNGDFGSRGMTLTDTLYAIHGTKKPSSIGKDESQGCIRMKKEDIEELFDMVPMGTKVTIGKTKLPTEPTMEKTRFHSPQLREETNPGRIYKWLN
jgi:lipoprotein-anchoring transpeptidase ErfK/SrfK